MLEKHSEGNTQALERKVDELQHHHMVVVPRTSTQESKERGLPLVQGQPGLPSKFRTSLSYRVRPCQRKKGRERRREQNKDKRNKGKGG